MISVLAKVARTTTWKDILPENYLDSGDIIPITLKSGEQVELEVAHDESGKQFIVFRDCLKNGHCMNVRDTNSGGWRDCAMRGYAKEVFDLLPDDLQEVIVPTKIVQVINGNRIECEDKLFCLSRTQVFGKHPRYADVEPEDSQLDIYKVRRNRVKGYGIGDNDYCYWWLRSPNTGTATNFNNVYPDGGYNYTIASNTYGVCFGFCVSINQDSEEEAAT